MDLKAVRRLINGRSLAVVGNAKSILQREAGEEIDGHDVVIRFNAGIPSAFSDATKPKIGSGRQIAEALALVPYIGSKTTVMAGSYLSVSLWRNAKEPVIFYCKTARCDDSHIRPFREMGKAVEIYTIIPSVNLLGVMDRPSGGLITVCFLLEHCSPKSLTLFGFDFFKTPTWYWKRPAQTPHDGKKESDWFQWQGFVDLGDGSFYWANPAMARK